MTRISTPAQTHAHGSVPSVCCPHSEGHDNQTTPAHMELQLRAGASPDKGHDRLMSIMPARSDSTPPTLATCLRDLAAAMGIADGCPRCDNTEPPRDAAPLDAGGWMAGYLCTDCGTAWVRDHHTPTMED